MNRSVFDSTSTGIALSKTTRRVLLTTFSSFVRTKWTLPRRIGKTQTVRAMSSRCFALSAVLTRHATQATRPHAMTSTTTTANTMTHYTVCSTHQPPLAVGLCQNEYPVHFESAAAVQCVMLLLHTQQVFSKLRVSFLFQLGVCGGAPTATSPETVEQNNQSS